MTDTTEQTRLRRIGGAIAKASGPAAQPEAQRLSSALAQAGWAEAAAITYGKGPLGIEAYASAKTIRAQHAEIQQLKAQLSSRQAALDGQWKCGKKYSPYHPSASHVDPTYRDVWNDCYRPPQREPLNINVVSSLMPSLGYRDSRDVDDMYWFARAIERAHGIGATND